MKKRSKIRQSQEDFPWVRAPQKIDDSVPTYYREEGKTLYIHTKDYQIPLKQMAKWTVGAQKKLEATIIQKQAIVDYSKTLLKSFIFDQRMIQGEEQDAIYRSQLSYKLSKLHRMSADFKSKNTCYFVGQGRTFNRSLFVARHTLRKLARFGRIPGLQKS